MTYQELVTLLNDFAALPLRCGSVVIMPSGHVRCVLTADHRADHEGSDAHYGRILWEL
jgi:hypothetical protein